MSSPSSSSQSVIPPGSVVGGRFVVERHFATDELGDTLLARDQKTNKAIALRMLFPHALGRAGVSDALKADVRTAAKLKHRSILTTYGVGTHDGRAFVACEWVQGSSIAEQVARHQGDGSPLSARGAYNVVAHVCKALTQVHASACHGALRPAVVWVSRSGRVKIGELGLGPTLASSGAVRLLDSLSQACLAPEVRAGSQPTLASDVYGVGALLYTMLTGSPPTEPLQPPSRLHPDGNAELDAVVARCLAPDPGQRYARVDDIANALLPLVAAAPEMVINEFGADLEIDVDIALSLAPPAPKPAAMRMTPNPFNPLQPAPMQSPLQAAPRRPSPVPTATTPAGAPAPPKRASDPHGGQAARPAAPPPVKQVSVENELASLMSKLTADDAARWMVVKNGLDHGPFTARELIKLIVDGEVLPQHALLNMSTSERKPVVEWAELAPFVEQYKLRKADADHAVALQKSERIERGSNAAKLLILVGSIGVVLIAGGGYLMSRQAAKKREAQNMDLAAMYESGKVKISGTAGILHGSSHRSSSGGGHRSSGGGNDSTGFNSYDDAMNQAMELGDATKGGGERQLRVADIQAVMDRKLNSLFGCVGQELRGGGRLGTIQLDLAILGSGQVAGASVSAGSPGFKKCLVAKLRQISFPSFPAPRMGARYSFDVN